MTVLNPYIGVQVRSDYCHIWCQRHTDCGSCASDRYCAWHISTGTCDSHSNKLLHKRTNNYPNTASYPNEAENDAGIVAFYEACPICESYNGDMYNCLQTAGCGWASLDNKCVTGRPNWAWPLPVTEVQWVAPGVCYKFSYNEKRAFGPFGLIDSFGFDAVSGWPSNHPKVYAAVAGGGAPPAQTPYAGDTILPTSFWSTTGALNYNDVQSAQVPSAVAFYAYNYPNQYAPNTGDYESDDILLYVLVDSSAAAFLILVVDSPYDNDSGRLVMNMTTTGTPNATVMASGQQPDAVLASGNGFYLSWQWGSNDVEGLVFGPMPSTNWSIAFNIDTSLTYGLNNLQVASYNSTTARLSFTSMQVKKLDASYGGGRIESLGCSNYCQIYDNCDECEKDSRCQFAPLNGGCISRLSYVETFDCPAPTVPVDKVFVDGGSTMTLRIRRPQRMVTNCPCKIHYYVVVYDMNYNEVAYLPNVPMVEDRRFTNALIQGVRQDTRYMLWVWACSQDQCATTAHVEEVKTGYD